jgi:hypothetical protein
MRSLFGTKPSPVPRRLPSTLLREAKRSRSLVKAPVAVHPLSLREGSVSPDEASPCNLKDFFDSAVSNPVNAVVET